MSSRRSSYDSPLLLLAILFEDLNARVDDVLRVFLDADVEVVLVILDDFLVGCCTVNRR